MEDNLKQWEKLTTLVNRLKKIGIEIKLGGNAPWIYLEYVNGTRVRERYLANHGFTIAWYPSKSKDYVDLTDIGEIFKVIRKYLETNKILATKKEKIIELLDGVYNQNERTEYVADEIVKLFDIYVVS